MKYLVFMFVAFGFGGAFAKILTIIFYTSCSLRALSPRQKHRLSESKSLRKPRRQYLLYKVLGWSP